MVSLSVLAGPIPLPAAPGSLGSHPPHMPRNCALPPPAFKKGPWIIFHIHDLLARWIARTAGKAISCPLAGRSGREASEGGGDGGGGTVAETLTDPAPLPPPPPFFEDGNRLKGVNFAFRERTNFKTSSPSSTEALASAHHAGGESLHVPPSAPRKA